MKIEDEILERIERLPDEKKAEVLRFLERVEASLTPEQTPCTVSERAAASMLWIAEHRSEFAGQWVAMDGARLVAHGADARAVADQARRLGVSVPFLHRVEAEEPVALWGGWL
jgi:hypothetical protein